MGLHDLLSSLLSGHQGEVVKKLAPPPPPPQVAQPPTSPNKAPGLYGLLPERMQNGTLRNTLGALGDAFLVGTGHDPVYRTRKDTEALNQALSGYNPNDPNSVIETIKKLSGVGSESATTMIDHLAKNSSDIELRKQVADQNNIYRTNQLDARNDQTVTRRIPYIGAMIAGAKDQNDYAQRYARADAIAKAISPHFSAADFGLVDPQDWTPEATAHLGMTANNVVQSADRGLGRATSERNTDVNAGARVKAAGISAGQSNRNNIRTTTQSDINSQRSAAQSNTNSERSAANRKSGRSLPSGLTVGGAPVKVKTPQDAAKLPKGTKYVTPNGLVYTR